MYSSSETILKYTYCNCHTNVLLAFGHKVMLFHKRYKLTLRLLMSYIRVYGAPSKARNANVVYIWTYVWQR